MELRLAHRDLTGRRTAAIIPPSPGEDPAERIREGNRAAVQPALARDWEHAHLTPARVRAVNWRPDCGAAARYAVAWSYLAGFVLAEIIYTVLPARDQFLVLHWASTNVVNLHHHPVASLVVSAFIAPGFALAWPALSPWPCSAPTGCWGTGDGGLCATGHVVGTLVSEGIVAYRTAHGLLPEAANRIVDVGPSYVVVSAITVAVLFGSWPRG